MNINLLQVPIANAELQLLQKFTKRKNIYIIENKPHSF